MKTLTPVCILLIFCSSCFSKLKVTVEIADHEKVKAEYDKIKQSTLAEILVYQEFLNEIRPSVLSEIITEKINSMGSDIDSASYEKGKETIQNRLTQDTKPNFDLIDKYIDSIKTESPRKQESDLKEILVQIKYHTNSIITKIYNYGESIKMDQDFDSLIKNSFFEYRNIVAQKEANLASMERTRYPILGDPLASYVVQDRGSEKYEEKYEDFWVGNFNLTKSTNFLGNSDIAVILRSSPQPNELKSGDYNNNFTIKGVRMDASDFANAFINTMTQTISFVAQTQGINIPKASVVQENNPVSPIQNPEALALSVRKNQLQELQANSQKVRQLILQKILEQDIRSLNEKDLIQHMVNVSSYWEILKPMLNTTTNGTTTLQD